MSLFKCPKCGSSALVELSTSHKTFERKIFCRNCSWRSPSIPEAMEYIDSLERIIKERTAALFFMGGVYVMSLLGVVLYGMLCG
jgi:transcription elongation factor Elf1